MRLIVTGSRDWDRPDAIWESLDILARELAAEGEPELVVVHGACYPRRRDPVTGRLPLVSADYLADLWIRRGGHPLPVRPERHPAKWGTHGKAAGQLRNRHMASIGADLCLAFRRAGSTGTTGMVRFAEEAGIPTQVIEYETLPEAVTADA